MAKRTRSHMQYVYYMLLMKHSHKTSNVSFAHVDGSLAIFGVGSLLPRSISIASPNAERQCNNGHL